MSLFKPWTWFGRLESKLLGEGGIDGTIRSFVNQYTRNDLTGAERQQNEFNAEQAEKQMDFQQQMSNTAYQRQVQDMQTAGVNPALMYQSGSNGASTPSGASASGSPLAGLGMSDLVSILKARAEIKNIEADTEATKVQTEGNRMQNEITSAYGMLTAKAKLDEINTSIDAALESIRLSKAQRTILIPAQAALAKVEKEKLSADMVYTTWRNEFYAQNHYWPGETVNQEFTSLLRWFAGRLDGQNNVPGSEKVDGKKLARDLEDALKRNEIGNPYR